MTHVLITGGSAGLGKVTAKKLLEAGYKVTILSHNETNTKAAADELGCDYVVADVADNQAVETAITAVEAKRPVDVLINNAGIWVQGLLEENDPAKIHRVIEVNTLGPIYGTRAIVPAMKKRGAGKIIIINSQGGLYAKAERGVYAASKWALTGFAKAMKAELKPHNISVISMHPGAIKDTNIFKDSGRIRDMSQALEPEIVAAAIIYVCGLPDGVNVPELGIETLTY
jgi:NADP-dependent 3-hydroxy acid dehydrogenase YdfG